MGAESVWQTDSNYNNNSLAASYTARALTAKLATP